MLFLQIKEDKMQALRDGDSLKKNLLSTLQGECTKNTKEPTDAEVIATVRKFMKNAVELQEATGDCGHEKYKQATLELCILEGYLPKQLTEDEIRNLVRVYVACGDITLGQIMKTFKNELEGRYDGAVVSRIVREIL